MLQNLVNFERCAKRACDMASLVELTSDFVRSIGFECFTLLRPKASSSWDTSILLTSYPQEWVQQIFAENRHVNDPIHTAVARSVDGVEWREVDGLVKLDDRQRETLAIAGRHGLRNGLTIPFRLAGMPSAMFSVAALKKSHLRSDRILAAKIVGSIVFAKAHQMVVDGSDFPPPVSLSPRQVECIRFIAQGMSDFSIGATLGLSPETVREYVENARQRYGVKRRTQLIGAAIRDGHLTLEEAVDWSR